LTFLSFCLSSTSFATSVTSEIFELTPVSISYLLDVDVTPWFTTVIRRYKIQMGTRRHSKMAENTAEKLPSPGEPQNPS
jgi:hypothetical protein